MKNPTEELTGIYFFTLVVGYFADAQYDVRNMGYFACARYDAPKIILRKYTLSLKKYVILSVSEKANSTYASYLLGGILHYVQNDVK